MKLSIIIPVFNEQKTIAEIIDRVSNVEIPDVTKEIIIVNDGSTDNSDKIITKQISKYKNIKYFLQKENKGKGSAVRKGISVATGDYIIIQDADLEYNPQYYKKMLLPVMQKKAEIVYGTRLNRLPNFSKEERTMQFLSHYLGNKFLSLLTSILYGQWMTDMETCYKLFPKKAVENIQLKARGFEFEPEITAKLLKKGYHIHEVSIPTTPRSYDEGKKLQTIPDGLKAFRVLIYYRFFS